VGARSVVELPALRPGGRCERRANDAGGLFRRDLRRARHDRSGGGSISETVGNDLINGVSITPLAATAGLLTAAAFIAVGVQTGYPIPAAFAVTGAVIGAGLALGGGPAFSTYQRLAAFWIAVPFVSASIAYGTATLLRRDDVPKVAGVPLLAGIVGFILANVQLAIFPAASGGTLAGLASALVGLELALFGSYTVIMLVASLAFTALVFYGMRRSMLRSADGGIRQFLIGLGAVVAFSSGGSQVGLAIGPLEPLFDSLGTPGVFLLALGSIGILLGA
jgi:phosphate/sulfate permease